MELIPNWKCHRNSPTVKLGDFSFYQTSNFLTLDRFRCVLLQIFRMINKQLPYLNNKFAYVSPLEQSVPTCHAVNLRKRWRSEPYERINCCATAPFTCEGCQQKVKVGWPGSWKGTSRKVPGCSARLARLWMMEWALSRAAVISSNMLPVVSMTNTKAGACLTLKSLSAEVFHWFIQ